MPYELERPATRSGVGPIGVYRSISNFNQPLHQQPRRWVREQQAFKVLSGDPKPEIAAALAAAEVPVVVKVWTELAYEACRVDKAPDMPSRLDSLYAYADPLEALSFTEITGSAQQVFRGNVQENVPWAVVDMLDFQLIDPTTLDKEGFNAAWLQAFEDAERYWLHDGTPRAAEILVAGPILLTQRLELLPLLRELELVEPEVE